MGLLDRIFGSRAKEALRQNWELHGQWGATSTAQKDIVKKLRDWRDRTVGPDYSEYYRLPGDFYKELDDMAILIRDQRLDGQLGTELASAVHVYYTQRKLWDHAAEVAAKYGL